MNMTNFEEAIVIQFTVAELLQTQSIQNYRPISSFPFIANSASLMHAVCDDALILLLESIFLIFQ